MKHKRVPECDPRRIAIHEAGHAVVAHYLGCRVARVWIQGGRSAGGRCEIHYPINRHENYDRVASALIGMAGHEADVKAYRSNPSRVPVDDYKDLRREGCSPYTIAAAQFCTRRILKFRNVWGAVCKVRRRLIRDKSLDRRAFLRALREG